MDDDGSSVSTRVLTRKSHKVRKGREGDAPMEAEAGKM